MAKAANLGRFVAVGTLVAAASLVCHPAVTEAKSRTAAVHHATERHAAHSSRRSAATERHHGGRTVHVAFQHRNSKYAFAKGSKGRYAHHGYYAGLQCVPFARAASGIELKGNAVNWWDAAAGVYQRGSRPEAGSVLNFRANGHMHLGHVAVVTAVLSPREIAIEHANWAGPGASKGGVSRNIPVEDVSPNNDWSEVRVGLGHSGEYGSVYPTYGFIYDRPDNGVMLANRPQDTGTSRMAASTAGFVEVAQAPVRGARTLPARLVLDAPSRNLQ